MANGKTARAEQHHTGDNMNRPKYGRTFFLKNIEHDYNAQTKMLSVFFPTHPGPVWDKDFMRGLESDVGQENAARMLDQAYDTLLQELTVRLMLSARDTSPYLTT